MNELDQKLQQLRQHQLAGITHQAVELVNSLLQLYPSEAMVWIEAIKQALLINQPSAAQQFYNSLKKLPGASFLSHPELLYRLAILLNDESLPELATLPLDKSAAWVKNYKTNQDDPHYTVDINHADFSISKGPLDIDFEVVCTCCHQPYHVGVKLALLIHREHLCPVCLARQLITFEVIKEYFETSFDTQKIIEFDQALNQLTQNITHSPTRDMQIPFLAQALNKDYTFYFTQLVLTRL